MFEPSWQEKYPHGVSCLDCSKPLTEPATHRRLARTVRYMDEDCPVWEIVCFDCLTSKCDPSASS